ncbi:hypothetical protein QAD02_016820 [Eretmocerus hayati]|uniref:Uncharacterized protein n=1 Tax=Eretmocerus hayati TaxID=131215 RepID=A0ACC2PD68_9HYME|nr:hypothetical protein QAD02_016820 [Eretmocerus hayati]
MDMVVAYPGPVNIQPLDVTKQIMFYNEEFASLQLDRPSLRNLRSDAELRRHSLIHLEEKPIERELHILTKGDEIQKLSVIETLPQLLAEDAHSCITRILPKIQQSLPTASTEFHMAAAVIFKQVLEQRLVSHTTFTEVFLHSILSSLENREPVISHAWLETILDVIELLPEDIIKREILPIAINEGKISQSVNSRLTCCRLMGKIATRFDSNSVKKDVLPTVHTLCQDVNSDVRACIALQMRFVAESLGNNIMKTLPFLVELANDEESNVRQAAIQTIGYLLPLLQPDTIKDIIVPLVKMTCENAVKSEDNMICVIAQEFGKLAQSSESYLTPVEKTWFIKYFTQLARMGSPSTNVVETKPDFSFITGNNILMTDRSVECRRLCAYNLPAMFLFASTAPDGINVLLPTFRNLANDSFYLVRRTIACSLHEVVKVLGSKSGLIKPELIRLLKDGHEEVLQGLIPNISIILENLLQNQLLDYSESSTVDLGRALIKCEAEVSRTNNWRLSALMLNQLEVLPKCFPSDFIYTYLVPNVTKKVLYARPLPVRLAAGRTLLIFLRYNLKPQQRDEIRNRIRTDFARSSNCYVRMVFIRVMTEAMTIYSSMYFKEHFCASLLNMMEDPVANVRLKVITLLPTIKSCLRLPADKELLSTMELHLRNLKSTEKDRDVLAALVDAVRQMESIEVRVDSQPSPTKLSRYDSEDMKKYEEEKKLEAMSVGKSGVNVIKKPNALKIAPGNRGQVTSDSPVRPSIKGKPPLGSESPKSSVPPKPSLTRQNALGARYGTDLAKASTSNDDQTSNWSRFSSSNQQLTQPWERVTSSCHNTNLAASNPMYTSSNDYSTQKLHCSCYELADRIFRAQPFSLSSTSKLSDSPYLSDSSHCSCLSSSNYLKTTNLYQTKHDYKFLDSNKPPSLTSLRDSKHDSWQDSSLSRSSFANKYRLSEHGGFQSHHHGYWSFSSMPEMPVPLVDDEFIVDAGIRIPSQLSSSQSTSKISNLQDIIYRNKKENLDRSRRFTAFDKSKSFTFGLPNRFSLDYEDASKLPPTSSSSLSSNRNIQYSPQPNSEDQLNSSNLSPPGRSRFGFEFSQRKPLEDKSKRNSTVDKDRAKSLSPKSVMDRKRYLISYTIKLPDTKESKMKFKRHSMEVADYNPSDRNGASRTIRRFSALDVNHNQGSSKIPVRNVQGSGSRTAPVTRTSSPIRVEPELFEKLGFNSTSKSYSHERRLRRFRSSDEEVEKLCHKF